MHQCLKLAKEKAINLVNIKYIMNLNHAIKIMTEGF